MALTLTEDSIIYLNGFNLEIIDEETGNAFGVSPTGIGIKGGVNINGQDGVTGTANANAVLTVVKGIITNINNGI